MNGNANICVQWANKCIDSKGPVQADVDLGGGTAGVWLKGPRKQKQNGFMCLPALGGTTNTFAKQPRLEIPASLAILSAPHKKGRLPNWNRHCFVSR